MSGRLVHEKAHANDAKMNVKLVLKDSRGRIRPAEHCNQRARVRATFTGKIRELDRTGRQNVGAYYTEMILRITRGLLR